MSWGPRWICLVGNFEERGSVSSDFGVGGGPLKTRMIGDPRDPIKSTFLSFDSVFTCFGGASNPKRTSYISCILGFQAPWIYGVFNGGLAMKLSTFSVFGSYFLTFSNLSIQTDSNSGTFSVFGRSFFLQIVFFSYFRKKVDHNLSGNQKSLH